MVTDYCSTWCTPAWVRCSDGGDVATSPSVRPQTGRRRSTPEHRLLRPLQRHREPQVRTSHLRGCLIGVHTNVTHFIKHTRHTNTHERTHAHSPSQHMNVSQCHGYIRHSSVYLYFRTSSLCGVNSYVVHESSRTCLPCHCDVRGVRV